MANKKKQTGKKKPGPKSQVNKWVTPDALTLLEAWARNGLIDKQIADKIGISATTLYNWKRKYPQIDEALANGKDIADAKVENALFKSALGYTYEETKKEVVHGGPAKITKTTKTVHPNVAAIIFWLKNRKPEVWREIITETQELLEDDNFLEALNEKAASVWQEKA